MADWDAGQVEAVAGAGGMVGRVRGAEMIAAVCVQFASAGGNANAGVFERLSMYLVV